MDLLAQETYDVENDAKERRRRVNLIGRMMTLWRECAEDYRVLPFKYLFLLEEKRRAKITLKKPTLRLEDYPSIPFFDILVEEEAREWLNSKSTDELDYEIYRLSSILQDDYTYRTIKDWVVDANYKLQHKKPSKFSIIM